MKKRQLEALIAALDLRLGKAETELSFVTKEFDKTRTIVMRLLAGVGGEVWTMKNGTKRVLIALSTPHLKSILETMRLDLWMEQKIKAEIERRELDRLYRLLDKAKTKKVRETLRDKIIAAGGHIGFTPVKVTRKSKTPCAWDFSKKGR